METIIEPSKFDGRHVTYVDRFKLVHTGYIVGQHPGGTKYYVQSDVAAVEPADWHFIIDARVLKAVLDKDTK